MKKKRIFISLALFASLGLISCTKTDNTPTDNTTLNNTITHDRGSVDDSPSNIEIPSELIEQNIEPTETNIEVNGEIDFGQEDIENEAGVGHSENIDEGKLLFATPKIGYELIGWFKGDTLLSTSSTFKTKDATGIVAKFKLKKEFENLIFESNERECILYGITDQSIYDLVIPEGITRIAKEAFRDTNVLFVTLPESIKIIDSFAFDYSYIRSLKMPTLPENISTMMLGEYAYIDEVFVKNNDEELENLLNTIFNYPKIKILNKDNSDYVIVDDYLFEYNQDQYCLLRYFGKDKILNLPEKLEGIDSYSLGSSCFADNSYIEEVTFPSFITEISDYAFYGCSNLKEVVIPDQITKISYYAFYNCKNLEVVKLGKNLETIESQAFSSCNNLYVVYNDSNLELTLGNTNNGYVSYYAKAIIKKNEENPIKENGDFKYIISDNDVTIIQYLGNDKDIVIPTFENKNIILDDYLFSENENIETVKLNDKVTTIGVRTFDGCTNLKKIDTLNVTTVGNYAFNGCTSLEEAIFTNVEDIPAYVCSSCYSLKNVKIPKAKSIGSASFSDCYSLNQIILPESLESIYSSGYYDSYKSFYNCCNLVEIINKSQLTITKGSSNNGLVASNAVSVITNESDSKLKVENNLIYINDNDNKILVGIDDKNAKKIIIPSTVTRINKYALYNTKVEELELHTFDNYLSYYFGNYSYYYSDCVPETLKKIVIGDEITSIPDHAFYSCRNIEQIVLNKNITNFGSYSFNGAGIKEVYYDGTVNSWANIFIDGLNSNPLQDGALIYFKDNDEYKLLSGKFELSSELTRINDYQFMGFSFNELVIPKSVTEIGEKAFYNCKELEKVELSKGLNTIGEYAFANSGVQNINLVSTISYIDQYAFSNSMLTNITIPASIGYISPYTFEKCRHLQNVIIEEGIYEICEGAFSGCSLLFSVTFPKSLNTLGYDAFSGCENLDAALLKETSVLNIPDYAFCNCKNLRLISFNENLESIASTSFEGCDNLDCKVYRNALYFGTDTNPYRWLVKARTKTIAECKVHPDCEKIFAGAFSSCNNLRRLVIPSSCTEFEHCLDGVKTIESIELPYSFSDTFGNYLFRSNNTYVTESLKNIIINGGEAIPNNAFKDIELDSISLSDTILTIGDNAFQKTNAIINVPSSVTTIGDYSYEGTKIEEFITGNVTSIGDYAFKDCICLTKADFSSFAVSSYSMGEYIFEGCTSLSDVTLPSKVTNTSYIGSSTTYSIPKAMFKGCTSLKSVVFPSVVEGIGEDAFRNSGIDSIDWSSVKTVYKGAFYGTQFVTITIPSSIKLEEGDSTLGNNKNTTGVFENCKKLTTVNFNSTFYNSYYGGSYAFKNCSNLTTVNLASGVTKIHKYMFYNCASLSSINLTNITEVSQYAFAGSGLVNLQIPSSMKLGSYSFASCKNLKDITFNGSITYENLTGSGHYFEDCENLEDINFSSNIKTIADYMFKGCKNLSFDLSQTSITTIGNYSFENTGFEELVIPSTITSMQKYAFTKCNKLTKVTLNGTLGGAAFESCKALNTVIIGDTTAIPYSTFQKCISLENVIFPDTLTSIGNNSFAECGLKEVSIPASVTTIELNAFRANNNLTKATLYGVGGSSAFKNCSNLKTVIFDASSTISAIPSNMFEYCESLTTISIPDSVETIGNSAFYCCTGLNSIYLPSGLKTIESYAFYNCIALKEIYNLSNIDITLGSSSNGEIALYAKTIHTSKDDTSNIVTDSNGYSFMYVDGEGYYLIGYSGNEEVLSLPESFDYNGSTITEYQLSEYAFYKNKKIKSVIIPDFITSISEGAFYNCENLEEISLSKNVKTIDKNAFRECISLMTITLPSKLETIGDYAFNNCEKLVEIYNLSNLTIGMGNSNNGSVGYYAKAIHTSTSEETIINISEDGFIYYTINDDAYILGYVGENLNIVLNKVFSANGKTYNNLRICNYAFAYSNIKSIVIPENIMYVGYRAFYNSSIEKAVFGENFYSSRCGSDLFYNSKLKEAVVPSFMLSYVNLESLLKLTIVSGTYLDGNKLNNAVNLESIVIPKTFTKIYSNSLYGTGVKKVYYNGSFDDYIKMSVTVSGYTDVYFVATKYYYSETTPTDNNNYWHYDESENVVEW